MRPRLVTYAALLAWAALSTSLLPGVLQHFRGAFFGPDESLWLRIPLAAWLHRYTGFGIVGQLWLLPPLVLAACALAQVAFELLAWRIDADRDDNAWSSFTWSLGSWRAALLWLGAFAGVCVLNIATVEVDPYHLLTGYLWLDLVLMFLPSLAGLATLSLVVGNHDNLARQRPGWRWRAAWPGWRPLVLLVVVVVAMDLSGRFLDRFDHPAAMVAGLLLEAIDLVLVAACLAYWIGRSRTPPGEVWRRVCTRHVMGPLFVQYLRLGLVLALAVGVPLLVLTVLDIHVLPQVEGWFDVPGEPWPAGWHAAVGVMRFATTWWWIAALALTWFMHVAQNRLLVRLGVAGTCQPCEPPVHDGGSSPP